MKMKLDLKDKKLLGERTIDVMASSYDLHKQIKRQVWSEKTLTPSFCIYWIELWKDYWVNTTLEGVRHGITVCKKEFDLIPIKYHHTGERSKNA